MTYKEKVLKRLNEAIGTASTSTERTSNRGEEIIYKINDLTATFFGGTIIISYKGADIPLTKAEASEVYAIFKEKQQKFREDQVKKILEEL